MKLLFLLVFAPFCLAHCPSNHFKDDIFKKCVKCTPCHVTVTPCSGNKDAVCASFNDKQEMNHHFLKSRLHFLDDPLYDSLDDDRHHDLNFIPHQKDHHKKNSKHLKPKHEDKHHHKKKHYEFKDDDEDNDEDDDDDDDSYENYDDDYFNFDKIEKPKKHNKKHYEFNKKSSNKIIDDVLPTEEELEDEKLQFILGKDTKKNKKKPTHQKKIDADEEELEKLLLQSEKKFKIRKDNLLKTLKGEKDGEKYNSKVRLNSPVMESSQSDESDNNRIKSNAKAKKNLESELFKAFADLHDDTEDDGYDSDDEDEGEDDLDSFLPSSEESYKPVAATPHKSTPARPLILVGQGKKVDDTLRAEMGKNVIYEKPHFKVIPFVVGKDFNSEKTSYSQKYHPSTQKVQATWDDDSVSDEYREIKTNEVVSLPFTAAETLVWDWQAVAVASAVASCLVFFLVVAIYFIVNTRHWKKVNKSYNKEIEEVSTRIALMQPMLELGSSDSHATSLYMENITSPVKEEEKKGDMKV